MMLPRNPTSLSSRLSALAHDSYLQTDFKLAQIKHLQGGREASVRSLSCRGFEVQCVSSRIVPFSANEAADGIWRFLIGKVKAQGQQAREEEHCPQEIIGPDCALKYNKAKMKVSLPWHVIVQSLSSLFFFCGDPGKVGGK